MELLEVLSSLFSAVWGLFTGVQVPGLGISFGLWEIALLLIGVSLSLLAYVFGIGSGGTDYRSGQSRNKHISGDRKDDEK